MNITHNLSSWVSNIAPSPTLAVDAKAKALAAAGEDVCGFGAGEPDFDTPEFIKQAAVKALMEGKTKYSPVSGILPLREALAQKFRDYNHIEGVTPDQIIISPGGKYSCQLVMQAICSPGDEVIIPTPYWVSYPEMAKLTGAKPVFVEGREENGFKITAEQLKTTITPKTRLLVLCSPSNPTGAVYTKEELELLMEVALKAGIYVMSDEIYEYLTYDNVTPVSPASFSEEAAQRVITVGGFSKTYSMTGWRIGTVMAAKPIASAITNLQSQTTSNTNTFIQYGALAALIEKEQANVALKQMLAAFDKRRLLLWEGLNNISGITCQRAQGAFYLFPNISSFGLNSTDFCGQLLESEKMAIVPGVAFGADKFARFSYAVSDATIEKGLERMTRFCKNLKK